MNAVAARRETAPALPRPWYDRIWQVLPVAAVFACFSTLYSWQAWLQQTPTVFFDELHYARLAADVAGTGERIGGGGFSFETLYAVLIAPAWLLEDTEAAYEVAKLIGVLVMTATAFPAYWLARTLVSRPLALFVAAATVAVPGLSYSSFLMQETLAYPYATACFLLMTEALASRSRRWIAAAAAASIVAPFVRDELIVIPPAFALAALFVAWGSAWARDRRARWSARHWSALVVAAAAALVVGHLLLARVSHEWSVATQNVERMLDHGASAAGALAIGLGFLPVVAGLAALVRPPGERESPHLRAFVGVFLASTLGFLAYTAGKGGYLSPTFANLVEERNLFYVSPLLFVATALWLTRLRTRPVAVAAATALVAVLVLALPYSFPGYPLADAPSYSLLATAHEELGWRESELEAAALAVLAVSAALVLLPERLRRGGRAASVLAAAVPVFVLAWTVTAQAIASDDSRDFAEALRATQPTPPDWLERTTGGAPALYIGQQLTDPTQVMLLAFWNRHLRELWSMDATQGPIEQTGVAAPNGMLLADPEIEYVVTDGSVDVVGAAVRQEGLWRLYRIRPPLRLRSATTGIYGDGWTTDRSAYSRFAADGGRAGFATVWLSRGKWCPRKHAPAVARIRAGTLAFALQGRLRMGEVTSERRWPVDPCNPEEFVLRVPPAPFRVEVEVVPPFVPDELDPSLPDSRVVGVEARYGFTTKPPALFAPGG